ncbi:polysaccharide deacetylase family protein [Paenibacillus nanensis]|uniref:polysaccharide deacetylase family protein n=1 Tax=Paenibacillus nanensis TaxID=393251 RepID=UPI001F0C1271|nr:polysaccharide deacetylase family protein [Paenibacillus nanensis]
MNVRRKDRRKIVKTVLQTVILAILAVLLTSALLAIHDYEEPDRSEWTNRDGFVAVSYFGVGRKGTSELIASSKLKEQLRALYHRGYVTISQEDVLAFYNEGKPLPEKALFLTFEDGRNDSALFVEPMLEAYNFKATMMTYANKMGSKEGKFLQPKDLLKMTRKGFWELGSNGYRLTYINIVDEKGDYLGVRNHNEFPEQRTAQYYTHYLMDFIRDANGVPVEDRSGMEARISGDYELMESIYTKAFGYVPRTYMIMHANTLYNGMNPLVEAANDKKIREMFQLHFNREGDALNTAESSPFDLSRVQPAAYWETNHLLMQLRHDTGEQLPFETGDKERAAKWELARGAAEFEEDRIALTSPPGGSGLLTLRGSDHWDNLEIELEPNGHFSGEQSVYLRYDENGASYVRMVLRKGEFIVEQKAPGDEPERLASLPFEAAADGRNRAELHAVLDKGKLSVMLDDKAVMEEFAIDERIGPGAIALGAEADWREVRWNEYDQRDTIYDAVFRRIEVREAAASERDGEGKQLFSNRLTGLQKAGRTIAQAYHGAVDWAIETF